MFGLPWQNSDNYQNNFTINLVNGEDTYLDLELNFGLRMEQIYPLSQSNIGEVEKTR